MNNQDNNPKPQDDQEFTNPQEINESVKEIRPSVSGGDSTLDPFDPARYRLTQNFSESLGITKALITVPVRKPSKESFVQTHPDPEYRAEIAVLELKEEREIYLVEPGVWPDLASESTFGRRAVFTTINRQGVLFLWPVRLPGADGKHDAWSKSALEAAQRANGTWVRVQANMSLGAYEVYEAKADLLEPAWPTYSMQQLLSVAFGEYHIESIDHPVLQRLRGEL